MRALGNADHQVEFGPRLRRVNLHRGIVIMKNVFVLLRNLSHLQTSRTLRVIENAVRWLLDSSFT